MKTLGKVLRIILIPNLKISSKKSLFFIQRQRDKWSLHDIYEEIERLLPVSALFLNVTVCG